MFPSNQPGLLLLNLCCLVHLPPMYYTSCLICTPSKVEVRTLFCTQKHNRKVRLWSHYPFWVLALALNITFARPGLSCILILSTLTIASAGTSFKETDSTSKYASIAFSVTAALACLMLVHIRLFRLLLCLPKKPFTHFVPGILFLNLDSTTTVLSRYFFMIHRTSKTVC